jgi:hypothetical protein
LRIKKPGVEVKISNLNKYLVICCQNGIGIYIFKGWNHTTQQGGSHTLALPFTILKIK